ncbi:hypothetical protein [Paucilactobacillus kaifaensis]|uniref:hypothetical protein n=1 Tax=Paucilactobacillus kaifaensis TaxID=2559921 RepID=UPI0010F73527|nr:hypothetical protein [Paucilactobacillus kaifaensis]
MTSFLEHVTDDCKSSYQYIKNHIWLGDLVRADIVLFMMLIGYNLISRLVGWYSVGFGRMMLALVLMDSFLFFERVLDYFGGDDENE